MNKEKKTKKMTIDDLAVVMAGSFSGLEERLTKKIDNVEDKLTKKIDNVEDKLTKKIDNVEDKLEGTNKRIDDLAETKVSKIVYKEIEGRVGVLEKKL